MLADCQPRPTVRIAPNRAVAVRGCVLSTRSRAAEIFRAGWQFHPPLTLGAPLWERHTTTFRRQVSSAFSRSIFPIRRELCPTVKGCVVPRIRHDYGRAAVTPCCRGWQCPVAASHYRLRDGTKVLSIKHLRPSLRFVPESSCSEDFRKVLAVQTKECASEKKNAKDSLAIGGRQQLDPSSAPLFEKSLAVNGQFVVPSFSFLQEFFT